MHSFYSVLGKKWNYDRETSILFFYISSSLFIGLGLLILPRGLEFPSITLLDILGFIWIGGFILAMGYLFWFLALKYGDTAELSAIAMIGPFIAFIWIFVLLGETITLFSVLGMVVVLLGNYFSRYREDICE